MKECGKASGRTILMSKGSFDKWFCCKQKEMQVMIQVKWIIKPAGVDAADKILV